MSLDLNHRGRDVYASYFGSTALISRDHHENIGCLDQLTDNTDIAVNSTLDKFFTVVEIRSDAFLKNERAKRAIGLAIAVVVSIFSLISSIGSAIYFETEISSIQRWVSDIQLQMQSNGRECQDNIQQ